jgi:cyclase
MECTQVKRDLIVFRGDAYQSVATAFLDDDKALLVDTLATRADAHAMDQYLRERFKVQVHAVVMTHYMSDHMGGLAMYSNAQIIAHRFHRFTYLSQRERTAEDDLNFVLPTVEVDRELALTWGRFKLTIVHNPGKTTCALIVDDEDDDLLLCGDAIVGNIVYISSSAPELIDTALMRLQKFGRSRVIPGHMGIQSSCAISNARLYLSRLRLAVEKLGDPIEHEEAVRSIDIRECLAEGVTASAFEQEWHGRNLDLIVNRQPFRIPRANSERSVP